MIGQAKYQIILLKNNECVKVISSHSNFSRVKDKFENMLDENKKIIFPIQYLNEEKIVPVKYYLAIIKRKEREDEETPKLKNEYGQYVNHIIVDNEDWLMFDKEEYNFEESFWVYGYNPYFYRKTFLFIYNELIKKYASNKYEFMRITYYKNKVLFDTYSHLDMVLCKNKDDAYRMYCLLDDFCKNDKLKRVLFDGDSGRNKNSATYTINKIAELTHWKRKKILRHTT